VLDGHGRLFVFSSTASATDGARRHVEALLRAHDELNTFAQEPVDPAVAWISH
jgi:hypothetical protein